MRKGYTLIEILVVIAIIGIATVSVATSYSNSQERVRFHTVSTSVQQSINNMRARALADNDENSTSHYITNFSVSADNTVITSYVDFDEDNEYDEGDDELVSTIALDPEIIEIRDMSRLYVVDGEPTWQTTTSGGSLSFIYLPPLAKCTTITPGSDSPDPNELMIEIPLYRPDPEQDNPPIRYLYLHKVACIPELLANPIREIE